MRVTSASLGAVFAGALTLLVAACSRLAIEGDEVPDRRSGEPQAC